jgi:hypothetical protein
MRAHHHEIRSSQSTKGWAKTEGKIEGDGTYVRRKAGLHEGKGGTRAVSPVPLPEPTSCRHSVFRVPFAPEREWMRWSAPDA